MTSTAVVPGAVVWSVLAAAIVLWLAVLVVASGALRGPAKLVRWLVGSWLSRSLMIVAWGAIGWHVFCQRP
jgi:hypothetical protein